MVKYWSISGRARTLWAAALVAGCGGGGVSDTGTGPGPTPPVDTTKPPTVQRASITTRITIDPVDAALASTAGIGVGGLTVRLTSSRAGEPVRTATTATDGTVRFDNLLEGVYTVGVDRALTAAELTRLAPEDREASLFAGGAQTVLTPPTNQSVDVPLVGARRGSVVISEIFANYGPQGTGTNNYAFGSYIELYNNGDTTAFLDGMLLMYTPPTWHFGDVTTARCSQIPWALRLDSSAVYSGIIMGFPGGGREYPIQPGEAKIVAMDAINHIAAAPEKEQVDLSRAQFEQFWTDGDVDNPESVNMQRVYGTSAGAFGRGMPYFSASVQHVLLSREARASLTEFSYSQPGSSVVSTIAKLRSEFILDLVGVESSPLAPGYSVAQVNFPRCTPWSSARYDRSPAPLLSAIESKSISRRSLGRTADGREILQRTRNSERDMVLTAPLRRSLNK